MMFHWVWYLWKCARFFEMQKNGALFIRNQIWNWKKTNRALYDCFEGLNVILNLMENLSSLFCKVYKFDLVDNVM